MSNPPAEPQFAGGNLPAFPCELHPISSQGYNMGGLTKRELIAAMVLHGMAAHYGQTMEPENMVAGAIRRADVLLRELSK